MSPNDDDKKLELPATKDGQDFTRFLHKAYKYLEPIAKRWTKNEALTVELIGDVFLKLEDKFDDIKAENPSNVEGYLYVIMRNAYVDMLRRGNRQRDRERKEIEINEEGTGGYSNPYQDIEYKDTMRALEKVLSQDERNLTRLLFKHEFSAKEIADKLKIKLDAARQRIYRLKQKISTYLSK